MKLLVSRAMKYQPFADFIRSKNKWLMVEPRAAPMNSVQIGNYLRVRNNFAIRIAPGLGPSQHSRKEPRRCETGSDRGDQRGQPQGASLAGPGRLQMPETKHIPVPQPGSGATS